MVCLYIFCFKPYYKWITFNTLLDKLENEIPVVESFKPYYKWITFNTEIARIEKALEA